MNGRKCVKKRSGLIKLILEICVEILKKMPINSIKRVNAEKGIRT